MVFVHRVTPRLFGHIHHMYELWSCSACVGMKVSLCIDVAMAITVSAVTFEIVDPCGIYSAPCSRIVFTIGEHCGEGCVLQINCCIPLSVCPLSLSNCPMTSLMAVMSSTLWPGGLSPGAIIVMSHDVDVPAVVLTVCPFIIAKSPLSAAVDGAPEIVAKMSNCLAVANVEIVEPKQL
eukprot:4907493-Amphidinium_carterae.2